MNKSLVFYFLVIISLGNYYGQTRKYYLDNFQDAKIVKNKMLVKISFLLVKEEKIPSFLNFKIKFSFPENIRLYNKIRKEGKNYGALMPLIYLGKTNSETSEFHYTNKRNGIYDSRNTLEFRYKKDITNRFPVLAYFFVVPYLNGQGKIRAEFSWTDKYGNMQSEVKESGIIRSIAPPINIVIDKHATYDKLIGELEYNYDYKDTIPATSEWHYKLISKNTGEQYTLDSPKIDSNNDIPAGSYTAKGEVKYKNTTWQFDKKIEINQFIESPEIVGNTTNNNSTSNISNPVKLKFKVLRPEVYFFAKILPYKSNWHTFDIGIKFLSFKFNSKFTFDLFDISMLTNFYHGFSVTNTFRVNYNFRNGLSLFYGNGFGFTSYPDYQSPTVVYSGILENNEIGMGYKLPNNLKIYLKVFSTMTNENSAPKYDGLFLGISRKF